MTGLALPKNRAGRVLPIGGRPYQPIRVAFRYSHL